MEFFCFQLTDMKMMLIGVDAVFIAHNLLLGLIITFMVIYIRVGCVCQCLKFDHISIFQNFHCYFRLFCQHFRTQMG